MPHELGDLVALGNTATIHEWGRAHVAKVLLPATPADWADLEAEWTTRLHATGLPVPVVDGVVEVAGRRAIVYERIVGPTMLAQIAADPGQVAVHADTMADLQASFHATPAPAGLPGLRDRLEQKVRAAALTAAVRTRVLDRLARLPDGDRVCHGDLHPGNVILTDGRAVVVDWFDVAAGNPRADLARTSLLVRPRLLTGPPDYLPGASNDLLHAFHEAWFDAYTARIPTRRSEVAAWELPVAAARLSEDVEHDDLEVIVQGAVAGHVDGDEVSHAGRRPHRSA